ncbi:MAG: GIY-YIG nuclease family protein [Phycisphaerae bacterium]|nr:GIY-YIG nuclease family protein [Phycisphaerae bacterium]
MSGYAYILLCADARRYYGSTNDLRRRLGQHRQGSAQSAM